MTKKVYSLRIANELVKLGYKIVDSEINIYNPVYKVFIFKWEVGINEAMERILTSDIN